jgi:uncharacterized secreted repeat protein (TIGR03808 family)
MQRAVETAAGSRMPLRLAPGAYKVGEIRLPANTQIHWACAAPPAWCSRAGRPVITAPRADMVTLSGLVVEGNGKALPEKRGLIVLEHGRGVRVEDCEIAGSSHHGIVLEGIDGLVRGNTVSGVAKAAIVALDSRGLTLDPEHHPLRRQQRHPRLAHHRR